MYKMIFSLLSIFVLMTTTLYGQGNLYVNQEKHYSIEFPPNWTQRPNSPGFDVMFESGAQAYVSVISAPISPDLTLDQFIEMNIQQLKTLNSYNTNASGEINIGGLDAQFVTYNYAAEDNSYAVRQLFFIKGLYGYVITCSATIDSAANYIPLFNQILSTFKFL